jgi:iron complex transport system ATP-binding protein
MAAAPGGKPARPDGLAVSLRDVCLEVAGARILDGVSWDVAEGEKWVVLGLNGSGKTSLLRLISGFGYPSRGAMEVLGEPFGRTDLRALRAYVGWVHADLAGDFPRFMTCHEVVMSGAEGSIALYETKNGRPAAKASAALEAIGGGHLAERFFYSLSTGERERVLIARALAPEPRLLLLDEPCLGLDPVAREDFLHSLSALFHRRPRLTVICVTHHVEEIIPGFSRVLLMAGGRAVRLGPAAEVMAGPEVTRMYGTRCRIEHEAGRYSMRFTGVRNDGAPRD